MATIDDGALQIRELARSGQKAQAEAMTQALLGPSLQAWKELGSRMMVTVYPLVESSLQTLAWLECKWSQATPASASQASLFSGLLDGGRRPLGHWLKDVCLASDSRNLVELHTALWTKKARYLDRVITHDRLKNWSSAKEVTMPAAALRPVLSAVRIRARVQSLEDRYYVARLLTFLCDLVRAGTPGDAPDWAEVQAQIKSRHTQLYRLEVERQLSAARA